MTQKQMEKREAQAPQGTERLSPAKVFMPRADIYETSEGIVVIADMPGVDESSVEVTLEKNILTINGTVEPPELAGRKLEYAEYEIGNYQRVFTLSDEVDREGITATVKNGVLKLVLKKAAAARTRKIQVKAE